MSIGVADLLGDWATTSRRWMRTRQARTLGFYATVAGSAVVAGAVSEATPTGYPGLDKLYIGALAAVTAFFGGRARRWTWFLPAGVGAALAADNLAIGLAAVALVLGFWTVLSDNRTPARAAAVTGLGVAAAMRTGPIGFHGSTALAVALAVLPVIWTGYKNSSGRIRRRARKVALIVGTIYGLMLAGAALAFALAGNDLVDGMSMADHGLAAARNADEAGASQRLTEAARLLDSSSTTFESWFATPARAVPFVGPNLQAVEELTHQVGDLAGATGAAADAADVDQLRLDSGRLSPTAVENVQKSLDAVSVSASQTSDTVDQVESPWLVAPVADRIDELATQLHSNLPELSSARTAVKVVHGLLAPGKTRRYLVLFVTPVEARGHTGFPGNYAELVVQDGKITMPKFGRVTELEEQGVPPDQRKLDQLGTQDFMRRYGQFEPQKTWRNITMAPDLPTVAGIVKYLYPQSGGDDIDGLLTVDPTGLAALMHFTQPVTVPEIPVPLTPENTVSFLQLQQYTAYPDASQRVDVLGSIARQTFEQLLKAELPSPKKLIDTMEPAVDGGHIQFVTFDPSERQYFDKIHLSGAFTNDAGQALSVVTNNAGGNKLDLFLQRSLRYQGIYDPATNRFAGKITVELRNNVDPGSSLPDAVVGNLVGLPRGTNRSYVSIYTSHDLDGAKVNGQPANMQAQAENKVNVYSTFVDVPPKGSATIELDVHGSELLPGFYTMKLLQQPLVNPDQVDFSLTIAGDKKLYPDSDGAKVTQDGRTIRWNGPLDHPVDIYLDTTGNLPALRKAAAANEAG